MPAGTESVLASLPRRRRAGPRQRRRGRPPRQVEYIRRSTRAADTTAAAALLLEQLVQPGFDPALGAEATRRYVRRKASIAVMEYRKTDVPERYPWTQAGISERHYSKLLPQFAEKVNGRYVIDDYPDLVRRITEHLNRQDRARDDRAALIDHLVSRLHRASRPQVAATPPARGGDDGMAARITARAPKS